jgi:tRNA(Ile2) C34 agmatinyltransferase TiaS
VKSVVASKPACRNCGATVRWLGKCPRCGKRAWSSLLSGWFKQH